MPLPSIVSTCEGRRQGGGVHYLRRVGRAILALARNVWVVFRSIVVLVFLVVALLAPAAAVAVETPKMRCANEATTDASPLCGVPYLEDAPRGVPSAATVVVSMVLAPVVYRRRHRFVADIFLIEVLAVVLVAVVQLPTAAVAGGPGPSGAAGALSPNWLRVPATALAILFLSKMLLLHRYAFRAGPHTRSPGDLPPLLAGPEARVGSLVGKIAGRRRASLGGVVQLVGRWGEGKSFALAHVRRQLEERRHRCVVVHVDVWQFETELNLHAAILDRMLAHSRYLFPYGWLHYPTRLLLTDLLGGPMREARLDAHLGKRADVSIPFAIPRLPWQRVLEREVARIGGRRWRPRTTVVVLDEIDRATPAVTQAALTLIHRSLNLPNMVILLAYIDSVIRFKAFNPLVGQLEDLETTQLALLESSLLVDVAGAYAFTAAAHAVALLTPPAAVPGTASAGAQPNPGRPPQGAAPPGCSPSLLTESLHWAFAALAPGDRALLQRLAAEKYLQRERVHLRPPTPAVVAEAIGTFPKLAAAVAQLVDEDRLPVTLDDVRAGLAEALHELSTTRIFPTMPPFRALEETVLEHIDQYRHTRRSRLRGLDELLLVLLLAVFWADFRYG